MQLMFGCTDFGNFIFLDCNIQWTNGLKWRVYSETEREKQIKL